MPFPFSSQQSITVPLKNPGDDERIVAAVVAALEYAYAADMNVSSYEITFRGGICRLVTSSNPLNSISVGVIRFSFSADQARIDYRLTFTKAGVIGAVMLMLAIPFCMAPHVRSALLLVLTLWLCILGGNYISTRLGFTRLLREATQLDRHPKSPTPAKHSSFMKVIPAEEWVSLYCHIRRFEIRIENHLQRFIVSRVLVFGFILATVGAFIAGGVRPSLASFAILLLEWSPFLLTIALHLGVIAIRRIRAREGSVLAEAWLPLLCFGLVVWLVIGSIRLLRYGF